MSSFIGAQAADLWLRLFFLALMFATCVLGIVAAVVTIGSHRSKRLAKRQENQFRRRMAQVTIRRRLAEIVDKNPPYREQANRPASG
jgi:threonine/homoserine/homoserine lactone efflux protein